jgi:glycosyltransferase involved in cell wall biosynthesis
MKSGSPNHPLVSILIPTLALDEAVSATLDSIPMEKPDDLEVLVQHGGIGSGQFSGNRPLPANLRIESRPDHGVYDAINRALARARGRYILVLGAGDTLRPGVLDAMRPHLGETPPLDAVYGDVWMMESDSRYFGEFKPHDFFRHNVCQQALFYRRELFLDMGCFDTRYPVLSDYEFNVRLFSRPGVRIRYVPLIVCDYKGDGLSSRKWRDDPWIAEREEKVARAFGISKNKGRKKQHAANQPE